MEHEYDAVVVGAGFAGMYMLHQLREIGFSARVLEAGSDVGGTWYWNRYPGARCDVESMEYSYQFSDELQQEWEWTERYPAQPEILRYANHVADRFDLRRDIQFGTRVASAVFDEEAERWTIETEEGETTSARFCIMATGCLSSTNTPDFPEMDSFEGELYHTGKWPEEGVDFTGKQVAVIGTGSSGIQAIPMIAEDADYLTVFQRTPNFSMPARNEPLAREEQDQIKANYAEYRALNSQLASAFSAKWPPNRGSLWDSTEEEREHEFERRWQMGGMALMSSFNDLALDEKANDVAADFVRRKIRETVKDPAVAELLCPDTILGCKRPCLDTCYFETFNRDDVELVDIKDAPIERFTEIGLVTGGQEYVCDVIVLATGFDAMTGTLLRIDIRGRDGLTLQDKWATGPRTYLGLQVHGFPNLFTISGPGSPSVLTNMITSIEQHVNWIRDCLLEMRAHGQRVIEAELDAEDTWVETVNAIADATLYPTCNSWYLGANVPGKPRVFMPYLGFPNYVETCNQVVANDYQGFHRT